MTNNTYELDNWALPLPITRLARHKAQEFASTQPTPQKAEQVRLNTLAVYVINDYLQMLGIDTNLNVGDSWNPFVRFAADVADLEIVGVGRLECRPIKPQAKTCYVPPEVWSERIGYVVVQIDESSWQATLLGFSPTVEAEELSINQLQPVEDLIDCLNQVPVTTTVVTNQPRVNLSQWLVNVFESGWQTVESLLNLAEPDLVFRFRNNEQVSLTDNEFTTPNITRAKLIDLGIQLIGNPVALIVELTPESAQKRNVLLQVHPSGTQLYLPPSLQLIVLDETGLVFLEAQARRADNYIQLQFSGLPGERFSVKVALEQASIIEEFTI